MKTTKHTPLRRDIVTYKQYPKSELIRFIVKDNKIVVDNESTLNGRGYYIAKENIEILLKKNILIKKLSRGKVVLDKNQIEDELKKYLK